MGLFGKSKQLKNLERQLTAAQMSFGLFARLPDSNKQRLLESGPREVSQAVGAAVRAGHSTPAKQMLDKAAAQTPKGATEEQWQTFLAPGFKQLTSR